MSASTAPGDTSRLTTCTPPSGSSDGDAVLLRGGHEEVSVALGRRVMVVGDLLLGPEASPSSSAVTGELARTLEGWQGPGLLVVCGNLFARPPEGGEAVELALAAHGRLAAAFRSFVEEDDRRLIVLPGWRDGWRRTSGAASVESALRRMGAEVRTSVDLELMTAAGVRRVAVRAAVPAQPGEDAASRDLMADRPWLVNADRLEDPAASARFVTSRTIYRRLARFSWVLLVPALGALALRLPVVFAALDRLFGRSVGPRQAISHAYGAGWPDRLLAIMCATAVVVVAFAVAQVVLARPVWRALGGGPIGPPRAPAGELSEQPEMTGLVLDGDDALDRARWMVSAAVAEAPAAGPRPETVGLIVGGSLRAELIHLDPGFFACPGGTTEVVREHQGRIGLPPVFVPHCQTSWIELETGAELHARLLLADVVVPALTPYERLSARAAQVVKGRGGPSEVRPDLVASWPQGSAWPPTPRVADDRVKTRRVRRVAASAILAAGVADLLEAVRPPGPGHLRAVEQVLSLGDVETARALMGFVAVAMVMLARGLLRGQRRAWVVAVSALSATIGLRLAGGALLSGLVLSALVLVLLVVERDRFCAAIDHRSWRSGTVTLAAGAGLAVLGAFAAVEMAHPRHGGLPPWPSVVAAVLERLVGVQTVALPASVNAWVSPSLLGVGCALVAVAAFLATRPVVDRRLSTGKGASGRRVAELRARDIVRRHGSGSLDYFALRDDKQWFFHRDTLVAYAVYGGVCLVSPDPIGPDSERVQAWAAFRRFADRHGWAVSVVGASEEWLPVFRASGMRYAYIGDEAVVPVQSFSLQGNQMKGLRQACTRVERKGYTVSFFDPARLDGDTAGPLLDLVARHRRGGKERGFSMTLSRLFDARDTGLLLTVVYGPDGQPAALCQFVPSRAIGGFSLDLMRRDPGDHPNGILDFALCATIEHLRQAGSRGLSLNFAALRATLDGEAGHGVAQRVERWALRRMSGVFQIESLWRFNAKYRPTWSPRYVVFDCAEQFVPTVVNILRAESLNEMPIIGRLLSLGTERGTAQTGTSRREDRAAASA